MASPNPPILVYDGDCAFCTRSALWVDQRLSPPASIAPSQALDLDVYGLSQADVDAAAWWIDADGRHSRGHAAIARALIAAGGAWGLLGRALLVPPVSWLARGVYAVVARNRSKMPGGSSACDLPRR